MMIFLRPGKAVSYSVALALALLLSLSVLSGCKNETPPDTELTTESETESTTEFTAEVVILHTNDTHGRVIGDDEYVIGIERIAAIHKNTPNSILVDAGDTFHGLPIATLNRGADIAALMSEAGYSAMAVGNHDFNYGWERLEELRDIAGFPFLASNVTKDNKNILDDTTVIEVDGVKVALLGITTEDTAYTAMPDNIIGLDFANPVDTARSKSEVLREQGADVIVALTHIGTEIDRGVISTQLASEVPEIDVIIDAHSHTTLPAGVTENGVLIAQAGDYSSSLGKVVITLKNGEIVSKSASLISFEEAKDIAPDETISAMMTEFTANLEPLLNQTVGESGVEMSSERSPGVRTQEMPLGSLVADAYREAANADIAIANGGDIRADIPRGAVTKGDIISVLPFGNTLMVKTVTPALLREVLENAVSGIVVDSDGNIDHEESPQGRFLQVSGFSFVYEPAAPVGERIVSVTLDSGEVLSLDDDSTEITLAASNYVMSGGDYYTMLADLWVERELGAADEALAEYIARHSPITESEPGRIRTQSF